MKALRIPYGIANFEQLRTGNYLFVDKSKYIEILEDLSAFQFFIRPRRFGKSLFTSMLYYYYDINQKDKFDELFGDLYIGKNPTPKKNSYFVLYLSFAGLTTNLDADHLIKSFDNKVINEINTFFEKYKPLLGDIKLSQANSTAVSAIDFLWQRVKLSGYKVMLIIDEYDNFANDLISAKTQDELRNLKDNQTSKNDAYLSLIQGEGYVRGFYKAIKEGCGHSIERLFMTGVSPVMLDDLASGFNITSNLTFWPTLNEMLGFTQEEVNGIFKTYNFSEQEIVKLSNDLKFYYNGYLFYEDVQTRVYNSDMVLYFLKYYIEYKKYPKTILDNNVKTDYKKIEQIASKFEDRETVERIIAGESVETFLVERFPIKKMYDDIDNFRSLLLYLGMLTIDEPFRNKVRLKIPNYVIKTIYWDYFLDEIKREVPEVKKTDVSALVAKMQSEGDIDPFLQFVSMVLSSLSNRDMQKFNEKYIKAVIVTLLHIDGLYVVASERETQNGYIDILLVKDLRYARYVDYEWLIELKYLKKADARKLESIKQEGLEQLKRYSFATEMERTVDMNNLKRILLVFSGKSEVEKFFV